MEEKEVFVRRASGLVRTLNWWDVMWYNILWMAPMAITVYGIWAQQLFPGVDLPMTAVISMLISLVVGLFYALFSAAMPRSGGDYIWISRVLHPILGFAGIFFLFVAILGIAGSYVPWFTQWGIAPVLEFTGNSQLAATISDTNFNFVLAIVIYIIFAILISRGAKPTMRFLSILGILILIGWIVFVGTLLTTPVTTFKANFNAYSGTNYDQIISRAQSLGVPTSAVASATLLGIALTYLNFTGFNSSVYMAGEIKEVHKTQVIGIIASILVFFVIDYAVYYASYVGMGEAFIISSANLAAKGDPLYTLPWPPFLHLMFQYATRNPVVFGLACFGWSMMTIGAILTYIFFAVRVIFAASFDRVLPSWLSKVDARYNSPYAALIFTTIVAIIMQVLWTYTPLLSYFVYLMLGWMIFQAFASIAGIIFPYTHRDIFETSPAISRKKIGPVPILSILGIGTLLLSIWIGYASISPAYVGTVNPVYVAFVFVLYAIGAVIYLASWVYHKRKGIPLDLVFKQLPPE
ncbi:MAG: APC family permease [Candidatus Bathyarchaeia archaeon]